MYGWNADIIIDYGTDTAIVTGYRTFGDRLNDEQLAIFKKYDNKAKKLKDFFNNYNYNNAINGNNQRFKYERLDNILYKMLQNAIKKVLKCK